MSIILVIPSKTTIIIWLPYIIFPCYYVVFSCKTRTYIEGGGVRLVIVIYCTALFIFSVDITGAYVHLTYPHQSGLTLDRNKQFLEQFYFYFILKRGLS